jgi:ADP-ribose pyrophosphatase YjhB (NUDIX family)
MVGQEQLLLPSCTVLARNDRDEILLARHLGVERWGTIGGMVEPEEHPRDAAVREFREETGYEITLTSLLAVVGGPDHTVTYPNGDQVSYVSSIFGAEITGGSEAVDEAELTAIKWFSEDDLAAVDLDRFATGVFRELGMLVDQHEQ